MPDQGLVIRIPRRCESGWRTVYTTIERAIADERGVAPSTITTAEVIDRMMDMVALSLGTGLLHAKTMHQIAEEQSMRRTLERIEARLDAIVPGGEILGPVDPDKPPPTDRVPIRAEPDED